MFQVQNLVAMVPFYLPMNALIQGLHKETTAHQNLQSFFTRRYNYIFLC